jgi:hypothetical protein
MNGAKYLKDGLKGLEMHTQSSSQVRNGFLADKCLFRANAVGANQGKP